MRVFRVFQISLCMFLIFICLEPSRVLAQVSDRSAEIIRKQLEAEKKRGQNIEKERKHLLDLMKSREKKLETFDRQLRNYETNLQEAQKIIDAAAEESNQILKRNNARELMFYRCLYVLEPHNPPPVSKHSVHSLEAETIKEAVVKITREIFSDIQEEKPRLDELAALIKDRKGYQDRILNIYLPADTQKKETHERLLIANKKAVQEKVAASKEIQARVNDLRKQLEEAQKRIEEIRRQHQLAEKRRQEEEQKRKLAAAQREKKVSLPDFVEQNNKPVAVPAGTLAGFQGKLPWPSRGQVVRPFGEYTHPEFKVTMKNTGIDVSVKENSPIRAVAGGVVIFTGPIPGYGGTVIVNHGQDYLTVYGNIVAKVQKNQQISSQQILGLMGGGGQNGLGAYHFEIRHGETALNPLKWLSK